ncbi:MAG: 23S rRNA (adenine(2503)-C(2))-methyltransferase RlmN [Lentisphaerae bacterium]|nr:23S rRNA (adenine(2503)-C(2))-methyltransferase RlmN [Lentisphaerota bacterium]
MIPFLAAADLESLQNYCCEHHYPAFRAKQIHSWLHDRCIIDPEDMKNLPSDLKSALKADFHAPGSIIAASSKSPDQVEKLLLKLHDGELIEMVIIPSDKRLTFCLSTQVGCPVGCYFCASGRNGLTRNLSAGEMLEEFCIGTLRAGRPDNLVFMGIGEGLLNFEQLAITLNSLVDDFVFSPRRITVSTSGFVPGMKKFAGLKREFNLAVSLHAPDDETRSKLIPPQLRYPVAEILRAADQIALANNRQYTLEYTLIAGINDSLAHAEKLGKIAFAHHAKINLIPYNETGGQFRRPSPQTISEFETAVSNTGARITRRVERGSSETAACGQLRAATKKCGGK